MELNINELANVLASDRVVINPLEGSFKEAFYALNFNMIPEHTYNVIAAYVSDSNAYFYTGGYYDLHTGLLHTTTERYDNSLYRLPGDFCNEDIVCLSDVFEKAEHPVYLLYTPIRKGTSFIVVIDNGNISIENTDIKDIYSKEDINKFIYRLYK